MVAKRFFRSKLSVVGLVTLILLFAFSFFGPLLQLVCPAIWQQDEVDRSQGKIIEINRPYEYQDADGETQVAYEYSATPNSFNFDAPVSPTHLLGTDRNGYDIFSRLMYGGRISLTLGFVVVILETLLGVFLGGLAGYFGKWVDMLIMRIVDIFNCIPTLPIMLIISYMLDANGVADHAETLYHDGDAHADRLGGRRAHGTGADPLSSGAGIYDGSRMYGHQRMAKVIQTPFA